VAFETRRGKPAAISVRLTPHAGSRHDANEPPFRVVLLPRQPKEIQQ